MNAEVEISTNGFKEENLPEFEGNSSEQPSSTTTSSPEESLSSLDDGAPVITKVGSSPGVEMVKKISGIPETASMEVLLDDGEECLLPEESGAVEVEETYVSSNSSGTLSVHGEENAESFSTPKEAVNMDLVLVALDKEENSEKQVNPLKETSSMEVLVDLEEKPLNEELENLPSPSVSDNGIKFESNIPNIQNQMTTEPDKLEFDPKSESSPDETLEDDEYGELLRNDTSSTLKDISDNLDITQEGTPNITLEGEKPPHSSNEKPIEPEMNELSSNPTGKSDPLDIKQDMKLLGSALKSTPNSVSRSVPKIVEGQPLSLETGNGPKFGDDEDDEYFEEFHLPNTHENAFVRHQSFRRKVKLTPINAPDAEHIEGLVRTGDLNRQGSIRRKILPEVEEDEVSYTSSLSSLSDRLNQDIQEIETIINDEEKKALDAEKEAIHKRPMAPQDTNRSLLFEDTYPHITEIPEDPHDSLMFGTVTLKKIQKCMNASSHKSIYHLSGRLQDILTPVEIEEVLNNSHLYSPFLTAEVLEALSLSLNDQIEDAVAKSKENSPQNEEILKKLEDSTFGLSKDNNESVQNSTTCSSLKVIPAPKLNLSQDDESDTTGLSTTIGSDNLDALTLSTDSPKSPLSRTDKTFHDPLRQHQKSLHPQAERSGHIEINTITPIDRADPRLVSQLQSVPPPPPDLIPEMNDPEGMQAERHWRNVVINGAWKRIDMKAIAPYKAAITHGGNTEDGQCSIIMISACLLPEKSTRDYNYIMDNLFMYALSYLETLVSEDYILIYLAWGPNGPNFHWMRRTYSILDRNVRKNLKQLLIVYPSLWSKTLIVLSRPFISSKFYRKLVFINSLTELAQIVPLDQLQIPDIIKRLDFQLMIKQKKKNRSTIT